MLLGSGPVVHVVANLRLRVESLERVDVLIAQLDRRHTSRLRRLRDLLPVLVASRLEQHGAPVRSVVSSDAIRGYGFVRVSHVRRSVGVVDGRRDAKLLVGRIRGCRVSHGGEETRVAVLRAQRRRRRRRRPSSFRSLDERFDGSALREPGRDVGPRGRDAVDARRASLAEDGEERGVEHDVREGGRVAARDESAAGRREMGLEGAREDRLEWCAVVGRARDGDGGCEGGCLPLAPSLRGPSRGAGGCERLGRAEVARHRVGLGEDERPVVADGERDGGAAVALRALRHGHELDVRAGDGGGDEGLHRAGVRAAAREFHGSHRGREGGRGVGLEVACCSDRRFLSLLRGGGLGLRCGHGRGWGRRVGGGLSRRRSGTRRGGGTRRCRLGLARGFVAHRYEDGGAT